MAPNKRTVAAQSVGMLLALGVGVLIGARSCSETNREYMMPKKEIHREYMMPQKTKIIYECPPDEVKDTPEKLGKSVQKVKKKKGGSGDIKAKKPKENLPEETAASQNKRKRLLSLVRSKSKATLQSCRGSDKQVYRLSVNLVAKKDGTVSSVRIDSPPGEVPAGILNCLRGRMKQWTLPEEDVVAQQPIVWGLTL